jgi:tRNA dimethylallyltransferase
VTRKTPIVVVAGPTASGKSALALALAERAGGEVCVADSRQVYRRMDVGTAKADPATRARVPHRGVDVADPDQDFDVAQWVAVADQAIAGAARRGVPVVVEGGTGLYLRALVRGLVDAPARDPAFREHLRLEAERVGWPALHRRLTAVDPDYAAKVQPTDPVRITRALEVHHVTGLPVSALHQAHGFHEDRYHVLGVLLAVDPATLRHRVEQRAHAMWSGGLLEETQALLRDLGDDHKLLATINYAQAVKHLRGLLGRREAVAEMVTRTTQFAKRQRTWFKAEPWLEPAPPEQWGDVLTRGLAHLRS